jgi:hypothetical protein
MKTLAYPTGILLLVGFTVTCLVVGDGDWIVAVTPALVAAGHDVPGAHAREPE